MHLPPLQPVSNSQFYVSGNVTVDPGAAIAPGVLLQADPDSEITIASGVCIGMGAILHAHKGKIAVAAGANIGTGVLIIGDGKIGANACIGSMTTIFNSSVSQGEVISPGSLIGDHSRQAEKEVTSEPAVSDRASQNGVVAASNPDDPAPEQQESASAAENTTENTPTVYGQARLNQLLSTLLPHRQALSRPLQDDNPASNSS